MPKQRRKRRDEPLAWMTIKTRPTPAKILQKTLCKATLIPNDN